MADAAVGRRHRTFLETRRIDKWWGPQLATFLVFTFFLIYVHVVMFYGAHYWHGPYLSPFFSPELWGNSPHALFGPPPGWLPSWYSPAMAILIFPAGFRFSCYYYRGAYYKAFWGDPPGCAVGEPRTSYRGEQKFPLILQNVHRFFLYAALVFIGLLSWDVWNATQFADGFGIGVGTVIMAVNVGLIASYTLGCHSLRHLIGGKKDVLPKGAVGRACYQSCTALNKRHALWAWLSLFSVMGTDVYIRLCSMGIITDLRII